MIPGHAGGIRRTESLESRFSLRCPVDEEGQREFDDVLGGESCRIDLIYDANTIFETLQDFIAIDFPVKGVSSRLVFPRRAFGKRTRSPRNIVTSPVLNRGSTSIL